MNVYAITQDLTFIDVGPKLYGIFTTLENAVEAAAKGFAEYDQHAPHNVIVEIPLNQFHVRNATNAHSCVNFAAAVYTLQGVRIKAIDLAAEQNTQCNDR